MLQLRLQKSFYFDILFSRIHNFLKNSLSELKFSMHFVQICLFMIYKELNICLRSSSFILLRLDMSALSDLIFAGVLFAWLET